MKENNKGIAKHAIKSNTEKKRYVLFEGLIHLLPMTTSIYQSSILFQAKEINLI